MSSRYIITRRIFPITHKFLSTAFAPHCSKHAIPLTSRISVIGYSNRPQRFYCQQVNAENLPAVEFDYVKRATTQSEVMIIDVREPDEIKEHGKIPNSVNIPLGSINTTLALPEKEFQQAVNRAKPKENTELIFYCMIGKRSAKAQQSALNLGFKNAKNYIGSWTDWATRNQ